MSLFFKCFIIPSSFLHILHCIFHHVASEVVLKPKQHAHLCPTSTHPKWPLNRLELTVALERHFWHGQGAVCHTHYPRFRLKSLIVFLFTSSVSVARFQIFPSSLISPSMLVSRTPNRRAYSSPESRSLSLLSISPSSLFS